MKFEIKKFSEIDTIHFIVLSVILTIMVLLIMDCPINLQWDCTFSVLFATLLNFLHREEDSELTQISLPMIISFTLFANKIKTSMILIIKPEALDAYKICQYDFEASKTVLIICLLIFLFTIGALCLMFLSVTKAERQVYKMNSLVSDKNENNLFSKLVISLAKVLCLLILIGGIFAAISRPLYLWIITGTLDYACFQKYILASSIDMFFHIIGIAFLVLPVEIFNTTFTTEQGGFLITDDKRIIKYKGKSKQIYVPRDFKLFMTDTFENCDSSYEIHFEEGTTEIPPLKFKKSFPKIFYPSSLVSLREYSLFIKNQNPYDNSKTVENLLNNPVFKIIEGCVVNTKNNTLLFKIEHKNSEFKIPDCIERIGKYAFDDLLLYKAYETDESRIDELQERITKYTNFTNGKDKEYEEFASKVVAERIRLSKISFNKKISFVHPEALELALGLREIYIPDDSDFDISEINPARPYIKYLGKGKKITHRMIERLLHIHEKIKSGCYPNSKQLAYDLETSEPTINRDIEYLRESRYAPIQYDFTNRGYYYTEDYELFFEK